MKLGCPPSTPTPSVYTQASGTTVVVMPGYVIRLERVRRSKHHDTKNRARAEVILSGTTLNLERELNGCCCNVLHAVVGAAVRSACTILGHDFPADHVSAIVAAIDNPCRRKAKTKSAA
jgi:hypothetical protein